jgi:hypothetical protein
MLPDLRKCLPGVLPIRGSRTFGRNGMDHLVHWKKQSSDYLKINRKLIAGSPDISFRVYLDTVLPLHKCLLPSWDYSEILFHDESHSLQMPLETFKKNLLFFYSGDVSSLSSGIDTSSWMEAFVLGIQMIILLLIQSLFNVIPSRYSTLSVYNNNI